MQEGQNELNIVIMAMVSNGGDICGGGDCRGGADGGGGDCRGGGDGGGGDSRGGGDGDTGTVRCQSINREHQIVSYF